MYAKKLLPTAWHQSNMVGQSMHIKRAKLMLWSHLYYDESFHYTVSGIVAALLPNCNHRFLEFYWKSSVSNPGDFFQSVC